MRQIVCGLSLLALLLAGIPAFGAPADEGWKVIGVRTGISATKRDEYFHQYEVFTSYGLPWSLRSESGWGVAMRLNASLGALHGGHETGTIGSLGPGVVFDQGGPGPVFSLGGDLYLMSRYTYGRVDLNQDPLFEGNLGLGYRFASGLGLGYRFLHMSNGGLGRHGNGNTGLDLHLLELSWGFR